MLSFGQLTLALFEQLLSQLAFGDVASEAAAVDKPSLFPVNTRVDEDIFCGAILAAKARFIIAQYFASLQALENILDHAPVGMKLRNVMADALVPGVAKQIEFGLIYAKNHAVRANPVEAHCSVFKEISQIHFAAPQRFFHVLALGNVFSCALVIEKLAARVPHGPHVIRHPDFGSVFSIGLKLKTPDRVVLVQQPLELDATLRVNVISAVDITGANQLFR